MCIWFVCVLAGCKTEKAPVGRVRRGFNQIIEKFTIVQTSKGKLKIILEAESAIMDGDKGVAHAKFVKAKIYDNGKFASMLTAEVANIDMVTNDVYCAGKCVLDSANNEHLETTDLMYSAGKDLIYSNNSVKITRSGEILYGTSFRSNTKLDKITVENQKTVLKERAVVTGDKLELKRENGNIATCKGNSKIFNKDVTITADKIAYNEMKSDVYASGNVNLSSKNQKEGTFQAYGNFAQYSVVSQKGEMCEDVKVISEDEKSICTIYADKINTSKNGQTINVDACQTIEKRPTATIFSSVFDGDFIADKMMLSYDGSKEQKKINMSGNVSAHIKIKD
ncbi:MAG: LPS export ABC transporter periplasmic protein LptC [Endomicrobium sp.]|jgi:LPS export ABC transporter protein LptC|nr:LPS export ABC transporter periplasmic protein LptC [Endomicrobium sp.]